MQNHFNLADGIITSIIYILTMYFVMGSMNLLFNLTYMYIGKLTVTGSADIKYLDSSVTGAADVGFFWRNTFCTLPHLLNTL